MATNIFELFGRIALDNSKANKGIHETTGIAESAGQKINAAFEKVGHAAVAVGKTIATGMAAGAAAIGALTKASIDGYAEYEQLVGGVETLFGDSQNKVMQFAQGAYKTAGMSANEYMSTVTSFSASLIQSLGGDTAAAADAANMAITDMSDNANKMGTDISMIQNAYQGFAKQNYTMLDNLKLGYGGTATEMARLINDSGVLGDAMIDLADTQNIGAALAEVGFSKMVEAIHAVQTEMGITGTTAKEASATIQGSVMMAKAAWSDLLVGMSDETADFELLIDNFVDSVGIAAENILPRIEIALTGAGKLIDRLIPVIMEKVPKIISDFLPKIVNSGVSIVKSLVDGVSKNKDTIFSTATEVITLIITTITDLLPQILDLGMELLLTIVDGIVDNLDEMVTAAIEVIDKIIDTLTDPTTLRKLLEASLEIIIAIAEGIVEFLPELTEAATNVVQQIVNIVTDDETLDRLLDAAIAVVMAIADFIIENVSMLVDAAVKIITKLVEFLTDEENLDKMIDAAIELLGALTEALITNVGALTEGTAKIVSAITEAILTTNWLEVGWEIIKGIAEGLVSGWNNLLAEHPLAAYILSNLGNWALGIDVEAYNPNGATGTQNTNQTLVGNGNQVITPHADGLNYVPYDGYLAELHKGEMVVPAAESKFLRSGAFGFGNTEVLSMLERILYALEDGNNASMSLTLNNREFARAVKAVT